MNTKTSMSHPSNEPSEITLPFATFRRDPNRPEVWLQVMEPGAVRLVDHIYNCFESQRND